MFAALLAVALAQAPAARHAGTFELDPDASQDPTAMMDRLRVSPLKRMFAPKRPRQVVSVAGQTLTLQSNGATETLVLDGVTKNRASLMGAQLEVIARLDGDAVLLEGTLALDGVSNPITVRRAVANDTLTVSVTLGGPKAPITLTRVFRRVP